MPRKLRELIRDYLNAGSTIHKNQGKGSHRKISHPRFPGKVILSGKDRDDAKPYQEKDLERFLKSIQP